ncbi:MAG TPA: hypothetical protein VLM89_04550 [Phycisphaerae bacterium]|nr:hypothetical protein [Phycisphaerae bacterium]
MSTYVGRSVLPVSPESPVASLAGRRTPEYHKNCLMQKIRFSPDEEKRRCRRRGLRCKLKLLDDAGGPDAQPHMIPGDCYNISDVGLYAIVPIGYGATMGHRYTFELEVCEPGPGAGNCQLIAQQGVIARTELLVGPDGQSDRVGIGVRLVGQRSGVIPMPS